MALPSETGAVFQQQETGALHEDRGLGARDAYQQMHAEADECPAQSADGDADRSDPLHQPDTQRYIDACLHDGADRGEMLFSVATTTRM